MRGAAPAMVAAWIALAAADARAAVPLEVHAARGLGGLVPADGLEVIAVDVTSGGDAPAVIAIELDGEPAADGVALAARGRARVTVARRVPAGIATLPAATVRARAAGDAAWTATELPPVAVAARPIVVVTDAAAAVVPPLDGWRRARGAGAMVAITPDAALRWPALTAVGAVVIDRPAAALPAALARELTRHLASGGTVCRADATAAEPRCVRAAAIAVPRTRQPGDVGPPVRTRGRLALALAVAMMIAGALRRRAPRAAVLGGVAALALTAIAVIAIPADAVIARGVRAPAGGGEDWVVAELGASELAALPRRLDGAVWLEPSGAVDGVIRLDDPTVDWPGSWRVRGFVAVDAAGWAGALRRIARPAPELP
ncbi:MAG: hypothetical protein KA201_34540 [Kofleriaceae bacterium]|nr:hypothetical protein [Kofleriaceae bacterium]